MESLTYFILSLFILVVLFGGIAYILSVLYLVIGILSRPKCPNCAKAIGKKTIRCPHCGNPLGERQPQEEINPELYTRVKTLVAEQRYISAEELTPDTHLADDLGIAGDDGYDLLWRFVKNSGSKIEVRLTLMNISVQRRGAHLTYMFCSTIGCLTEKN